LTKKPIPKAIYHVKKWVEVRDALPKRWQRMDGIKNPGQERQRHDDKVLKNRHLIKSIGPDASNNAERS
jgi:hypothetical protein